MKWSNKFMNYFLVCSFLLMMITHSFAQEQQVKETIVCSNCNAENPLNAKFCSKCGSKLAEQIVQPEPEGKILEPIPPVLQDESLIKPEIQKEIVPKQKEVLEPTNTDELKARAIYDSGKALFRLGAYKEAADKFEIIILEYPATNYAEASILMLEACKNIQHLTDRYNAKPESKKSGSSSFITGMLGGCVGVGLVILILAQALD